MRVLLLLLTWASSFSAIAQQTLELPLWPDGPPTSNGLQGPETGLETGRVGNISQPTITAYLPAQSNGAALIACPGGGYSFLSMGKGGYPIARWLNEQGIALVLLKYRLPNGHPNVPFADLEQAMRRVKKYAGDWKINPEKIGVFGTSAGGHLASVLATRFSNDTRPAFQVLLYPVITMEEGETHAGSRKNLLGESPSDTLVLQFSTHKLVSPQTPPAFIVLSDDDKTVIPQNSILYYQALKQNKVPAEMHIYPSGGHGWGFKDSFPYKPHWTAALKKWLELQLTEKKVN